MFRTDLLSIIRSLNTVFTAIGYRYKQYTDKHKSMILLRCISYIVSFNDMFPLYLWTIFTLITFLVCLFVFLALQPFWLYFPQPGSGLEPSHSRFLDHTQRRATVSRTPLDEWSSRRRDLYLTTHNTHNRQTSIPSVGMEATISAGERP
jgi:hypothetical protein